jgi:hypothetical protein
MATVGSGIGAIFEWLDAIVPGDRENELTCVAD